MAKRGELYSDEEINQLDYRPTPQREGRGGFMKSTGLFFGGIFSSSEYRKAEEELQELNVDDSCKLYYDSLRDQLIHSVEDEHAIPHLIAFTSCSKGEGVTTVATNFASTLARHNDGKILLIDANNESPSIHQIFGINRSPGLEEILWEGENFTSAIQTTSALNMSVIASGEKNSRTMHLFESDTFTKFLRFIKNEFDFVIFDAPPMCEFSGKIWVCSTSNVATKLGRFIDGVILVIETERVRYQVVKNVQQQLTYARANILGVVLNKRKFHVPKWIYRTI